VLDQIVTFSLSKCQFSNECIWNFYSVDREWNQNISHAPKRISDFQLKIGTKKNCNPKVFFRIPPLPYWKKLNPPIQQLEHQGDGTLILEPAEKKGAAAAAEAQKVLSLPPFLFNSAARRVQKEQKGKEIKRARWRLKLLCAPPPVLSPFKWRSRGICSRWLHFWIRCQFKSSYMTLLAAIHE